VHVQAVPVPDTLVVVVDALLLVVEVDALALVDVVVALEIVYIIGFSKSCRQVKVKGITVSVVAVVLAVLDALTRQLHALEIFDGLLEQKVA
jgi:hypothetical protein